MTTTGQTGAKITPSIQVNVRGGDYREARNKTNVRSGREL